MSEVLEIRQGERRVRVSAGTVLVVGRDPAAGLRILNDAKVSGRHLTIWFDAGWRVRSDGRNGTYLAGQRIETIALAPHTLLHLADPQGTALELQVVAASTVAPLPPQGYPPAPSAAPPSSPGWGPTTSSAPVVAPPPIAPPPAPPPTAPPPAAPLTAPPPGPPLDPPARQQEPVAPAASDAGFNAELSTVHQLGSLASGRITIGRTPDNQITVDDLLVSRHHAALQFDGRVWTLSDLGSSNGTFVDGRRITAAQIGPQNLISIGHQTFRLEHGNLTEYEDTGAVTFEAHQLTVQVGERRILDRVSFSLPPKNMLVIVGPSGSGKSTLLRALTGTSPATYGGVGYGGRDLYTNYDEIRQRIGLVPQDDILHPQLHVREALLFAGQLRFPPDVDHANCARRVDQVITELGLTTQAGQRISTLSGGQRKRTSTAMELLTRPSLLFLDEPTSGLDINRDREVMQVLRRLADDGRTVVVISHNVTYLDLADKILVLATGGQLAYYGPPDAALRYFGCTDWADMYALLEQPRTDWYDRYIHSAAGRRHGGLPQAGPVAGAGRAAAAVSAPPPRQQGAVAQFGTLARRYVKVVVSDKAFVGLMTLMPIILAIFAHAVPGDAGLSYAQSIAKKTHSPVQLLLVLVIGGCLSGSAGAVREIVKERPIFERERAIGLAWGPYLASKVVVLGIVSTFQAVVLTVFGLLSDPGPDHALVGSSGKLDIVIVLVFVTFASMTLGLLLSAVVTNADRTMPLLVLIIMAQLLLSGGLFPVRGRAVLEQLSWLSPARWGYAAGASVSNIGATQGGKDDPLWHHTTNAFVADLLMLVVLSTVYLVVAALFLRRVGQVRQQRPR